MLRFPEFFLASALDPNDSAGCCPLCSPESQPLWPNLTSSNRSQLALVLSSLPLRPHTTVGRFEDLRSPSDDFCTCHGSSTPGPSVHLTKSTKTFCLGQFQESRHTRKQSFSRLNLPARTCRYQRVTLHLDMHSTR